jgi:hypothetical protein
VEGRRFAVVASFSRGWEPSRHPQVFAGRQGGVAEMGVANQFACASLVALFSIALLVTANLFVASRTSKSLMTKGLMTITAQQIRVPL